jgi:tRNA A-37 threonylcarbamoyl transferase component Bud32
MPSDNASNPTQENLEFPGAPLSLDSRFYISRPPLEEQVCREVEKPGSVIRIQAPRRMGKSSLLNRLIAHAKAQGYRVVNLDFQQAEGTVFTSLDKFLRWFSATIARKLRLPPKLDEYWDEETGSKVSCTFYFEDYLLEEIDSPILLTLNEVNLVFEYPEIAKDFLPLLRFWHEQAKQVEAFQKLRLAIAHSTEVYVPLQIHQSPFNVGLPIKLTDFNLKQTQDLAGCYGLDWAAGEAGTEKLAPLLNMVGGNPYRLNLAFYYLHRQDLTLEKLLETAPTSTGIYSSHLQDLWETLQQEPALKEAWYQAINTDKGAEIDPIAAYKLHSLGLVTLHGSSVTPSCELYRRYFRSQLLERTTSSQLRTARFKAEAIASESPSSLLGGRYRSCSQLGSGGFGHTYLAEDTHRPGNPRCVVKKLAKWFSDEDLNHARRLFATEAKTLEQLGIHDRIPRLLAYFEQDSEFYLVQELIEGRLLSQELVASRSAPWGTVQIVEFLADILPVLRFVHQYQTIHRDIKPENLIRRDSDGKLVLIDFGVAKQTVTMPNLQERRTLAVGTCGYAPPEQIQGHPQYNSDIYAVGTIAIEAAIGSHPDLLSSQSQERFNWREFTPQIDVRLARILERMVQPDCQQRYQTVREVLADLQAI